MAEKTMRSNVLDILRGAGMDALAVENPCHPGTPDVNFVEGWIELKQVDNWPARIETILALPHFTQVQRIWLRRRWKAGGSVWLLLQVGDEWLIFPGTTAAELVGKSTRLMLIASASKMWTGLNELTLGLPRFLHQHDRRRSA